MGNGAYLQTIESEEVMETGGCDNYSQLSNHGGLMGSSVLVTNGNMDD